MYRLFGKRLFDLVFSLAGIVVCLPISLVVAVLIKLDSSGPVFFVQKRMGKDGILFSLFKFRTMTVDASAETLLFEPGKKNRVTRLGRFLRQAKIDELPQLLNVFAGDMSFVGPRPEVPKYREFYSGENSLVLTIRPGITDMASLKYRHEEELLASVQDPAGFYAQVILLDKLKLNKDYVNNGIGFINDLVIIFKTLLRIK
ncbi:MAG: sugar transferase [Candidatus Omnitrophota bacterium]|jgi:lipopolysaccharide/colanic/teichoic acid biosynthesis glycosyltransferase